MATESRDAHVVVEIPADGENHHHQQLENDLSSDPAVTATAAAMQNHPLKEIAESPGHLLLLKLWQREEDLSGRRIGAAETRLEGIKREVFQLCCLFFAFHGLFLTLLFTCAVEGHRGACRDWWVPVFLSLLTSVVLICAVQVRLRRFCEVSGQLQRERGDARALARCVQELRMKGASFDLSREPAAQGGAKKRMKSSSVEVSWRPLRWCYQNLVTIGLLCATGVVVPASKFILCA